MKSTIIRYGIYATLAIVALSMIQFFVIIKNADYTIQEIAGWLSMVLATLFVFFGIRHYRDRVNNGYLSFGQGLKLGALIVLFPAVFFGFFDILYTEVLNPEWANEYYGHYIEVTRNTTPPEKLDEALKKIESQREMFSNPIFQFFLMAASVFIVGFIVTIISSLALMKKRKPAVH